LRLAADERVGLGTTFQDFYRFGNEFPQAIYFPDLTLLG